MLEKIISGGQTGADIAGIDAAIEFNFPYGGWLPKGRKTEIGPLPLTYQMQEVARGGYPKRTEKNIKESDGTVIFTHTRLTGGSRLTVDLAESWGKPWLHINFNKTDSKQVVLILSRWIKKNNIKTLNVAGSRASKDSDIYKDVFFTIKILLNNIF
jgi:hypothetical protein